MSEPVPFDNYIASLSQLDAPFDPTTPTAQTIEIRAVAEQLAGLSIIDRATLAAFIEENPRTAVPVLGLAVGLSQERLKNVLRHHLGSSGWTTLSRTRAADVIAMFDDDYEVVRLIAAQRSRGYTFGDVLVGRAGTRRTATAAGETGRKVEDEIEAIAGSLGLQYQVRTRFQGRDNRTAPCDLAIPGGGTRALIAVAAKGFDSTGSKLTAAVGEIEDMAEVRLPTQFIMAVVDGIGWKSRIADLRRIHKFRTDNRIDGLYTLNTLADFRADLKQAAKLRGLLPE